MDSSTSESDSSSFSDSEMLVRKERTSVKNYAEVTVKNYSDEEFKSHFRMSRDGYYYQRYDLLILT